MALAENYVYTDFSCIQAGKLVEPGWIPGLQGPSGYNYII